MSEATGSLPGPRFREGTRDLASFVPDVNGIRLLGFKGISFAVPIPVHSDRRTVGPEILLSIHRDQQGAVAGADLRQSVDTLGAGEETPLSEPVICLLDLPS
jgi:hypothetical protein